MAALQRAGADGAYGSEIAQAAGVSKTTIYDVLARIEKAKWATSEWEDIDPSHEKRPRRRIYRLTADGTTVACRAVESNVGALLGTGPGVHWLPRPQGQTS